jgi:hypothetical protein
MGNGAHAHALPPPPARRRLRRLRRGLALSSLRGEGLLWVLLALQVQDLTHCPPRRRPKPFSGARRLKVRADAAAADAAAPAEAAAQPEQQRQQRQQRRPAKEVTLPLASIQPGQEVEGVVVSGPAG